MRNGKKEKKNILRLYKLYKNINQFMRKNGERKKEKRKKKTKNKKQKGTEKTQNHFYDIKNPLINVAYNSKWN